MTTPRRPSAAQRRAAAAEQSPAEAGAPEAAAPDAAGATDAPDTATEEPGLVDRAKAAVGGAVDALIGGDGDGDGDGDDDEATDGDDEATDGPEEPSSDGEETCVHPTCEDPTIPAGEEYFMATRGPAQGPMHHSCSHKTIPIR